MSRERERSPWSGDNRDSAFEAAVARSTLELDASFHPTQMLPKR